MHVLFYFLELQPETISTGHFVPHTHHFVQSEHIGISLYDLILEEDEESVKKAIQAAQATAIARLTYNCM